MKHYLETRERAACLGLANVPVFSGGRQREPKATDKPVCCNALLASIVDRRGPARTTP